MTDEELTKARSYAIDKMRYNEVHSIFNEVETTVKLFQISFYSLLIQIDLIINRYFTLVMEKVR
jgi:hypothetical protein